MTKNPFINAISATAYIAIIASVMFYGTKNLPKEDSVYAPIVIISLFTLSAAMMGYLFLFQPLQLYLDGKKKLAVNLFIQTLATFAGLTALFLVLYFTGILK
jgi:hypothetical protein